MIANTECSVGVIKIRHDSYDAAECRLITPYVAQPQAKGALSGRDVGFRGVPECFEGLPIELRTGLAITSNLRF